MGGVIARSKRWINLLGIAWILFLSLLPNLRGVSQSSTADFSSGQYLRLAVSASGVWKIDAAIFQEAGISLGSIQTDRLRLFGMPGGSLPQDPSQPWPHKPQEIPLKFFGLSSSGQFTVDAFALFFAEGPHQVHSSNEGHIYVHNPYSDVTYYYLQINANRAGKRINARSQPTVGPEINTIKVIQIHTNPTQNILFSGRKWYSERFDLSPNRDFFFDTPGRTTGSTAILKVALMTQSFGPSNMQVNTNGLALGQIDLPPIPQGTYALKGIELEQSFLLDNSSLQEQDRLRVNLNFRRFTGGGSNAFLDYLLLETTRNLRVYEEPLIFKVDNEEAVLQVQGGNGLLWQKTAFDEVFELEGGSRLAFRQGLRSEFAIFNPQQSPRVKFTGIQHIQDLTKTSTNPDFVIITPRALLSAAQRLAAHRQSFSGLVTEVVNIEDVLANFSAGRMDPTAVRNFLRQRYATGKLKYVLLMGRGSFDFKDRLPNNINLVPTYQSRNSVHPILTFASDDYFGILSGNKGIWEESNAGNYTLDAAVGRLPAKNAQEAQTMIEKIIAYELNPENLGDWRNKIIFAADDGDANIHQRDAERLAQLVDTTGRNFQVNKLYLDDFPILPAQGVGRIAPEASRRFAELLDAGALIVNYTGHGSERQLAAERLFDEDRLRQMRNRERLPIFVTATCEFGRNDNPDIISAAEQLLLNPNGGAIAMVSTTRPVFSSTNYQLNLAFYQQLLTLPQENLRLGDVFRATKDNSLNGVLNRNFILLGDPSMRIGKARNKVQITAIDHDQSVQALNPGGKSSLAGLITNPQGHPIMDWNGTLTMRVMDAPVQRQTLGQDAAPFLYLDRNRIIFQGQAEVVNGAFQLKVPVSIDLSEQLREGRVFMYALPSQGLGDASGYTLDLALGGPSERPVRTNGPSIYLWLDSEEFNQGDIVSPNPTLIAKFQSDLGIDLSRRANHTPRLFARLDGETVLDLTERYLADPNTYQSGSLTFPLFNLASGPHTLTLFATDNHGNEGTKTVNFVVSENTKLQLRNVSLFPNPARDQVSAVFEHNKSGEPVAISFAIYNLHGQLVRELPLNYEFAAERISGITWDVRNKDGSKVSPGVYVYSIRMQSLRDGSSTKTGGRLIVLD